jgi:two-component system, OmpR family, response regulator
VRVLVVEDERGLAAGLRLGLTAEGFAVDVAYSGTDGLWRAREHPYDVVVLDIMLPGLNGYRVCRSLRADGIWTPILMLTAKDGEWDEVEALDTGADDYLSKPFSYPVLLARLRALVRRGDRERPAVLRAGDLLLHPAARRVCRGDTEIELTARELAVLELLMRHPGEVLSKRGHPRSCLGRRVRREPEHRGGLRSSPAAEAGSPFRPQCHPDRARCGLSAGRSW